MQRINPRELVKKLGFRFHSQNNQIDELRTALAMARIQCAELREVIKDMAVIIERTGRHKRLLSEVKTLLEKT